MPQMPQRIASGTNMKEHKVTVGVASDQSLSQYRRRHKFCGSPTCIMLLFGSHFEGKIRFHLPAPIIKFTRPPVRVRHQIDWQADQPEERGQHTDLLPSAHDCLPRTAHSVALWTDWCER